jgi:hypothetical protein
MDESSYGRDRRPSYQQPFLADVTGVTVELLGEVDVENGAGLVSSSSPPQAQAGVATAGAHLAVGAHVGA